MMNRGGSADEEDLKKKATAVFSLFDDDQDGFVNFDIVQEQILSMEMPEAVKEIISSALSSLTPSTTRQISRSDFVSAFLDASSPSSPPSSPTIFSSSPSSSYEISEDTFSSPSFSSSFSSSFSRPSSQGYKRQSSSTFLKSDDFFPEDVVEKELFNEVSEENQNLRFQIKELEDRISHLEGKQIVDLQEEVEDLRGALRGAEEEKKVGNLLRNDVEELTNTIQSLEEQMMHKDNIISSLAEEKQKSEREYNQHQKEQKQEHQQLQQQLNVTEKKITLLINEREKKEGGLVKDAEEVKEILENTTSALSLEGKKRRELEEQYEELLRDLDNANNQNIIFLEKVSKLEEEKEQLEEVITSQQEKLAEKRKLDEEQEKWLEDLQRGSLDEEEEEEEEIPEGCIDNLWRACYSSFFAPTHDTPGFRKFTDE